MLKMGLIFKNVFTKYAQNDSSFSGYAPSELEWKHVDVVCRLLEKFNDATKIISGSGYPTSNMFLSEVYRVKVEIDMYLNDVDNSIADMAKRMKEKCDKYWSETNLVMSIGACLDPRFKLKLANFCFPKMYKEYSTQARENIELVKTMLYKLFQEYVEADDALKENLKEEKSGSGGTEGKSALEGPEGKSGSGGSEGKSVSEGSSGELSAGLREFLLFLEEPGFNEIENDKSELDIYLEEATHKIEGHFDCLMWWKVNSLRYPILSKMARDILAIPITTVASESAFSVGGGRVIETKRVCKPNMVQVLLCGGDSARELNGLKGSSKNEKEKYNWQVHEVEVDLFLVSLQHVRLATQTTKVEKVAEN